MSETSALDDELHNPYDDPRTFIPYLLADLVIDSVAQRPVDSERVRKIAHAFDWLRFETPTVVPLGDGRARVIEGQHRVSALRSIAPDDTVVTCAQLPIVADRPAEAALALAILCGRRGHSALERWRLLVNMGQPHEIEAEAEMSRHGVTLGASPDPYTIAAVQAVSRIIHGVRRTPALGAEMLGRVLDVIGHAFAADEQAIGSRWDGRLLRAVGELLTRHPDIDVDALTATLGSHESITWIQRATRLSDEPVWQTIADMVWSKYSRVTAS